MEMNLRDFLRGMDAMNLEIGTLEYPNEGYDLVYTGDSRISKMNLNE